MGRWKILQKKDQLAKFGTSHGPVASYMQMFNIMQYVTNFVFKSLQDKKGSIKIKMFVQYTYKEKLLTIQIPISLQKSNEKRIACKKIQNWTKEVPRENKAAGTTNIRSVSRIAYLNSCCIYLYFFKFQAFLKTRKHFHIPVLCSERKCKKMIIETYLWNIIS